MESQRYIINNPDFIQSSIDRVKRSVRRLQYTIDKTLKYQPIIFNETDSHTLTSANLTPNYTKNISIFNNRSLEDTNINFHKNNDSLSYNDLEINIPSNQNNFIHKIMNNNYSTNKYKTKTLKVPKNKHRYNFSFLNNNDSNTKFFDESNSTISRYDYKSLKHNIPSKLKNNSLITEKLSLNNLGINESNNLDANKVEYMTPNHFFPQKTNIIHNKNSDNKKLHISNSANFNIKTGFNVEKNYSDYLQNKVETTNKNNRELIIEYENVVNQYKLAFEKNVELKNKIENLSLKSKKLQNINEDLTNNYNDIVNNLLEDPKIDNIEKNNNIISLINNNQKLGNKLT